MAAIASFVFAIGAVVASVLVVLLVVTLIVPRLRIWPTPGDKSWQNYVFWPLFRGLNVLSVAIAVLDRSAGFGLPLGVRAVAGLVLAAALSLFLYAFFVLGRDNSYGAQDGLVTGGIYRWSRNPQNAMLIVFYGALALAADGGPTYVLCAAMMAVYTLMVFTEEPWLEGVYGDAFRSYCRRVPRFFNWRRAGIALRSRLRGKPRSGPAAI